MKNKMTRIQNKLDKILKAERIPSAGIFILLSVPGRDDSDKGYWFIFNTLTRKSVKEFTSYNAAKNYLLQEFSK